MIGKSDNRPVPVLWIHPSLERALEALLRLSHSGATIIDRVL